jgi:hypothetical protein
MKPTAGSALPISAANRGSSAMMFYLLKIIVIWLLLEMAAMVNGAVRDKLIAPVIDQAIALPLSGVSLWFDMTLAFEYLVGHYMLAKSWHNIHDGFNPRGGNLFLMVLLVTAAAPW